MKLIIEGSAPPAAPTESADGRHALLTDNSLVTGRFRVVRSRRPLPSHA